MKNQSINLNITIGVILFVVASVYYSPDAYIGAQVVGIILYLSAASCLVGAMQLAYANIKVKMIERKANKDTGQHGRAHWPLPKELQKHGLYDPGNGGVPLCAYKGAPVFSSFTHRLSLGGAGTHKTTGLIIPELCHMGATGDITESRSAIIADLKTVLYAQTAQLREEQYGDTVLALDPAGTTGAKTVRFNPLSPLVDMYHSDNLMHRKLFVSDAAEMAEQLIPDPPGGPDKNQFFRLGARKLIRFLIVIFVVCDPENATLPNIARTLMNHAELERLLKYGCGLDVLDGAIADLAKDLLHTMATSKEHFGDFREQCSQAVAPYQYPSPLADSVSCSDFDWKILKENNTFIYIISDPSNQKAFAPWIGLMFHSAIKALIRCQNTVPVTLIMDEGTGYPVQMLPNVLAQLREYGIRLDFSAQSEIEIERTLGPHMLRLLEDNCDVHQYLGPAGTLSLAEKLSKRLGNKTDREYSYNFTGERQAPDASRGLRQFGTPILPPDEIMILDPRKQITFMRKHEMRGIVSDTMTYNQVRQWYEWLNDNPLYKSKLKPDFKYNIRYRSK